MDLRKYNLSATDIQYFIDNTAGYQPYIIDEQRQVAGRGAWPPPTPQYKWFYDQKAKSNESQVRHWGPGHHMVFSFGRAPIIVCHDTHAQPIGWKDVHVPTNYKQLTYTACDPYLTTIFYQDNIDLKSILFDNTNYMFKHWCIDTSFWTDIDICEWHRNQDPL
jgi:hypothetical protein